MTDADFSEVYALEADLRGAPERAARFVKKAVEVNARHMKDDWSQQAARNGLEQYGASIDYDMKYPGDSIDAEIGPNLGRAQGPLGLVEDAGGGVKSAPQHARRDVIRANEGDLERGLLIALADATEK